MKLNARIQDVRAELSRSIKAHRDVLYDEPNAPGIWEAKAKFRQLVETDVLAYVGWKPGDRFSMKFSLGGGSFVMYDDGGEIRLFDIAEGWIRKSRNPNLHVPLYAKRSPTSWYGTRFDLLPCETVADVIAAADRAKAYDPMGDKVKAVSAVCAVHQVPPDAAMAIIQVATSGTVPVDYDRLEKRLSGAWNPDFGHYDL